MNSKNGAQSNGKEKSHSKGEKGCELFHWFLVRSIFLFGFGCFL
jgi:hypothetical protein